MEGALIFFVIGILLVTFSLIFHLIAHIVELIRPNKDYKWWYFTYNITWWIGFPCFIIGLIWVANIDWESLPKK